MDHEVFRGIPWPYAGDHFPEGLGVVVQRTVLDGDEPARAIVHDSEGDWLASDEINNPNVEGAAALVCMRHLVEADPSIASLAAMPPGTVAWRSGRGEPWKFEPHTYPDEEPGA